MRFYLLLNVRKLVDDRPSKLLSRRTELFSLLAISINSDPYQLGYTRDRDGAIRFVGLRLLPMYQMRLIAYRPMVQYNMKYLKKWENGIQYFVFIHAFLLFCFKTIKAY